MLYIFLLPLIGLISAWGLARFFPKAEFKGYDILPLFFIVACHLISVQQNKPEFLPYGFFTFFILIVLLSAIEAIKNKNISLIKLIRQIWDYLILNTIFWYLGLLFMMI